MTAEEIARQLANKYWWDFCGKIYAKEDFRAALVAALTAYVEAERRARDAAIEDCPSIRAALDTLVRQLDKVHADPAYIGVWQYAHVHGYRYQGPTYEPELAAAKEALKAQPASADPASTSSSCGETAKGEHKRDAEELRLMNAVVDAAKEIYVALCKCGLCSVLAGKLEALLDYRAKRGGG